MKTLIALIFISMLSGCSSFQIVRTPGNLESTPPATALNLKEKHSGWNMTNPYSIPAGTYLPVRENENGYFYEAPSKITVSPFKTDGGIFWDRNLTEPKHVYMADGDMFWDIVADDKIVVEIIK